MLEAEEYRATVQVLGGLGIFRGLPRETLEGIARRCVLRGRRMATLLARGSALVALPLVYWAMRLARGG